VLSVYIGSSAVIVIIAWKHFASCAYQ